MAFSYETKSDMQFIIVENLIGNEIVSLFTNNGGEYIGLTSFLNQHGGDT